MLFRSCIYTSYSKCQVLNLLFHIQLHVLWVIKREITDMCKCAIIFNQGLIPICTYRHRLVTDHSTWNSFTRYITIYDKLMGILFVSTSFKMHCCWCMAFYCHWLQDGFCQWYGEIKQSFTLSHNTKGLVAYISTLWYNKKHFALLYNVELLVCYNSTLESVKLLYNAKSLMLSIGSKNKPSLVLYNVKRWWLFVGFPNRL